MRESKKFSTILDGIDENWTIKEKARYCYTNICKNISYDERFIYSENTELLKKIYYREINVDKEEDTRVICHTANKIYSQLLERLNIPCKIIFKPSAIERKIEVEDVALIFWDEEGKKYYTNIVGDIQNCRYGLQTKYFGNTKNSYKEAQDVTEISLEELMEIDKKIEHIKIDYSDIVFKLIVEEVKNTNHFKKFLESQGIDIKNMTHDKVLENKLQYLTRLIKFRDKTSGPSERKIFYKKLFSASALDKFESEKFNAYEFFKEENEEIDMISCLELKVSEEFIYYYYSEEEQTYITIEEKELLEKIKGYKEKKGRFIGEQSKENSEQDEAR